MKVRIQNAEEFDGQFMIELKIEDGTKVILYGCTTDHKIKGMYREITESDYVDIPEQKMTESEDKWYY